MAINVKIRFNEIGPVLVKDLQTPPPFKKSRFEFMILNDALCFEKNEKPKKNSDFNFLRYGGLTISIHIETKKKFRPISI